MSDLEKEISELADYFNELDLQVQWPLKKEVTKSGDRRKLLRIKFVKQGR